MDSWLLQGSWHDVAFMLLTHVPARAAALVESQPRSPVQEIHDGSHREGDL
jgi:hypothetical protein